MHVRLLGTAAGGGLPHWNCGCHNCHGVRTVTVPARPRTQSSVAVSADGRAWFLLNASPDLRSQVEAFPPLWPQAGERGSGIRGVLLTGADLDYTLGLILLREGGRLIVYAPPTVRAALDEGLQLSRLLERFCGLDWRAPPDNFASLTGPDGSTSGLSYAAFPVPGKPPGHSRDPTAADEVIGYRIVDDATGGRLVYVPGLAVLSPAFRARAADCDLLLLDGTFWSDDEMTAGGFGPQTARAMGHLPVGGPDGTLAFVAQLPPGRVVYVHVNNTNPMLKEDSPQRPAVTAAGAEVGYDGQEFTL